MYLLILCRIIKKKIKKNKGRYMPIFGVRNFTLNQHLEYVSYNMDKDAIFWVHEAEKKEESWNFVPVFKTLDLIFGVPKALGLIFRGQQRYSGMDLLHIESIGSTPWAIATFRALSVPC